MHLPLPAAVAEKKVVVLPQCLKGINGAWPQREAAVATGGPADGSVSPPLGIGLPETGGKINLAFGYMLLGFVASGWALIVVAFLAGVATTPKKL